MAFDLRSIIPVVGGVAPHGGNGFLRGWQRAQQEAQQRTLLQQQTERQQQQSEIQREQLGLQRDANTRANAQQDRLAQEQRMQAIAQLQQMLGDEAIDSPEAFDQRAAFATHTGPMVGLDQGYVESLVREYRPTPDKLTQRKLKKVYSQFEKMPQAAREQFEAGGHWEIGGQSYTPAQARQALGFGGVDAQGQPLAFTATAKPESSDDAPLDRRYLTAGVAAFKAEKGRDPNPTELQGLIREAKKVVGQADDRPPTMRTPPDPEIAELRKDLLRLQVERAGTPQPATQSQDTAGLYANRIEQAEPILAKLEPSITGMNYASFEAQRRLPSVGQSATMQSYMQAARNFINAVLRRESGAVISPSEFAEARQQYLPQPGDGPDVLAQKRANRAVVFDGFKRSAGKAYAPLTRVVAPLTKDAEVGGVYMHNGKKVKVREKTRTGFLFDEVSE